MESPYYEMTHDIQHEHDLQQTAFSRGYSQGVCDENNRLIAYLIKMSDEELINWARNVRDRKNAFHKLTKYIRNMTEGI